MFEFEQKSHTFILYIGKLFVLG